VIIDLGDATLNVLVRPPCRPARSSRATCRSSWWLA